MRMSRLRKALVAATVAATPIVVVAVDAASTAPAPQAINFVCASVVQVSGLCIGPPVNPPGT